MKRNLLSLVMAILVAPYAFAYTDEVHLGSEWGQVNPDDPLSEKNVGRVWCHDRAEGERAKKGEIDWKESSARSYCKQKDRHEDDTWKTGWRRNRKIRGCVDYIHLADLRSAMRWL